MALTEQQWSAWRTNFEASAKAQGRAAWLLDRNGEPYMELRGWVSADVADAAHDIAQGTIAVRGDNPAVPWLLQLRDSLNVDRDAILHEAVHMIVRTAAGVEWGYRVHDIQIDLGSRAGTTVSLVGVRPLEHLKHLVLRSNTSSPDAFQLKWSDIRQGQSLRVVKEYIVKALERDFQPLSLLGAWDLSTPDAYSNVDGSRWRLWMKPQVPSRATEWTIIEARYDNAWDALNETVKAAGLMVTADYWFPGDPQPSPDYVTLTKPTIVFDVVDRSHHNGATGTIADPLRGIRRAFGMAGENALSDILELDTTTAVTASGLAPWVVWRPQDYTAKSRLVITKSTDDRVVIGGKSPAALNTVLGTGIRALAAGLGSMVPGIGPALAVIAGDTLSEAVKDRILAFQTYDHPRRRTYHGDLRYREVSMSGEAWTISAVQQGVAALEETGGALAFEFDIEDDKPYKHGRDFVTGDQVGVQTLGMTIASYVDEVHLVSKRGQHSVSVAIGDARARQSTAKMLSANMSKLSGIARRIITYVGSSS
ncbi:Gp37-like protein [Ancrocorticia populi]|uniref:Gp37-like protein n=1 Tax=Ancrocorticia populi TaxID=2175228 RepID=UPI003F9EA3BA